MLLALEGIQKRFGGVQALSDGNLSVDAGEAHLLLGENGAGKSTLMKIVAGMHQRDSGRMLWQGREVHLKSPADAAAIGIAMVHQESLLAPHLSVAENIFLGREPRRPLGWVNRGEMLARAARLIEEHHFPAARRMARRKAQPGGQATGRDLPRHPAWLEPAHLRRAHFLALRNRKRRKCSASSARCASARWA